MIGVRAIVLDVDTKQRRLSLGLKASYFTDAGDAAEEDAQVCSQQQASVLFAVPSCEITMQKSVI